jgi:uncharacterized membrane protein required for colicin V production
MFLIDNIFVSFGGILFQQVVGIPMGTNCAPLLANLFYTHESEFLQKLVKDKKIHEAIFLLILTFVCVFLYCKYVLLISKIPEKDPQSHVCTSF